MKNIFMFFGLLILGLSSFSQVDTVNTLEEHQAMFSEIDKSKITTGILYDRVLPISGIEKFNGKNNDVVCKKAVWKQIYFELQNARYEKDTIKMPNLDFIFGRKDIFSNGKIIPIYLLNYKYNKIKNNAIDDELIFLQNEKLIENTAKNESPYEEKNVFVASPYKANTYYGNNFSFILNDNFLYTNKNEKIIKIYANFYDGFGYNEIKQGKELPVSYSDIGKKVISLKAITENNDTLITKFAFEVKVKSIPNYTMHRFQTTDYTSGRKWFCTCNNTYYETYVGAISNCFGCSIIEEKIAKKSGDLYHFKSQITPNKIDRVLLIVEGFDMNDEMFAEELYCTFNKQKLADVLLANNYDIFIVNYDVPTDDIKNNAILVENVIDYINRIKGNKTELIVAGGSMGGLVTRYALTSMEQKGKDVQTRLWISFDSPQKGANIPLGVQYFIKYLGSTLAGSFIEKINAPAAKQMLLYHYNDMGGTTRTTFYNDLNNKGFPTSSRNIGITNGASSGIGQDYAPGTKLLEFKISEPLYYHRRSVWALPNGGTDFLIYERKRTWATDIQKRISNADPLDSAPGGFRNTLQQLGEMDDILNGPTEYFYSNHAFIPAISALALNVSDYYYNFYGDDNILNKTLFDEVYFPRKNKQKNQEHVWLSHETALNIMNELYPANVFLPNADWEQGEIYATNSIHFTNGFHANANMQIHAHIVAKPTGLIPENWVSGSCDDKNIKTPYNVVNIVNFEKSKNVLVYPNPTTGQLTIDSKNLVIKDIIITNITGEIIKHNLLNNYKTSIDLSDQANGIYFIKIITDNKILTHKIIKQ